MSSAYRWPGHCRGCGRERELESRPDHAELALCDDCNGRRPRRGPTPKLHGLERAAHIGRILAEDIQAGVPFDWTVRDVRQVNDVAFAPPYSDAKLYALVQEHLKGLVAA